MSLMTEAKSKNAVTAALASLEAILKEGNVLGNSDAPFFAPLRDLRDELRALLDKESNNENLLACLKKVDHALQEFSNRLISDMRELLP
jgi:hypothetical protein